MRGLSQGSWSGTREIDLSAPEVEVGRVLIVLLMKGAVVRLTLVFVTASFCCFDTRFWLTEILLSCIMIKSEPLFIRLIEESSN